MMSILSMDRFALQNAKFLIQQEIIALMSASNQIFIAMEILICLSTILYQFSSKTQQLSQLIIQLVMLYCIQMSFIVQADFMLFSWLPMFLHLYLFHFQWPWLLEQGLYYIFLYVEGQRKCAKKWICSKIRMFNNLAWEVASFVQAGYFNQLREK